MTTDLDQVWQRFVEGGRTCNYFDALDQWAAGRGPLAAFVMGLEPFPAVTEAIRRLQLPLRNVAAIDLVPPHLMRVVALTLGFVGEGTGEEEISAPDLTSLSERAAVALDRIAPVPLRLGGVNSLADRIFVEVEDGAAIARMRETLASALPPALRTPPELDPWPRVELAYYSGERPNRDAVSALAAFRAMEMGSIEVSAVGLVTTPLIRARRFAPPTLIKRYHLIKEAP